MPHTRRSLLLFKQGKITEEVFGVFFTPTNTDSSTNGEITFGCTDTGTMAYTLVVSLTRSRWQRWPSCLPSFRAPLCPICSRPAGPRIRSICHRSIEGRRRSASARIRLTTAADENRQHTSTDVDDVSMHPPDPSPPPDRPENTPNKHQSFKHEGERILWAISNETSPDDNTHVSGALGWVKDANDVPKKLKKTS